jgi:hypothetical protein
MWQFCRTIGKCNHNNTMYNILCCGTPPNFQKHLQKFRPFRRYNRHSSINFTFIVPFDTSAPLWHMLPSKAIITPAPIVFTYGDQSTISAALFSTVEQHHMLHNTDDVSMGNNPSSSTPPSLNALIPESETSSTRSQLKALNWSTVPIPVEMVH